MQKPLKIKMDWEKFDGKKITTAIGTLTICSLLLPNPFVLKKFEKEVSKSNYEKACVLSISEEIQSYYFYCILKYCQVYQLQALPVFQVLKEVTNQFSDERFLTNGMVENVTYFKKYQYQPGSIEEAILWFVYDVSLSPEKWGLPSSAIQWKPSVVVQQDPMELLVYYARLFDVDPILATAITYQETGCLSSYAFLKKHNYLGMMAHGEVISYANFDAGAIAAIKQLKKYQLMNLTTIQKVQSVHAPIGAFNDPTQLNQHWINSVTYFYEDCLNHPEDYPFLENEIKIKVK